MLNLSFGMIKGPEFMSIAMMEKIHSMHEAVLFCIQQRKVKYTQNEIAALLDIDRGHWAKILKGKAHFPLNKLTELMKICSNMAPLQRLLQECGYDSQVIEMLEKLAA